MPFDVSSLDNPVCDADKFVCDHIRLAFDCSIQRSLEFIGYQLNGKCGLPSVNSPLEAAFLACWEVYRMFTFRDFLLIPQFPVTIHSTKHYKLDFALWPVDTPIPAEPKGALPLKVGVELDGHAYHERTRDQVQARDTRDRDLASAGWQILHFSWQEFNAGSYQCCEETYGTAYMARDRAEKLALQSVL